MYTYVHTLETHTHTYPFCHWQIRNILVNLSQYIPFTSAKIIINVICLLHSYNLTKSVLPWNEIPDKIIYGQQFSPYTKKFHNFWKNYIVNFKDAFSRSNTFVMRETISKKYNLIEEIYNYFLPLLQNYFRHSGQVFPGKGSRFQN